MTDLLDKAAATARNLPPEKQDEIARVMLAFIGDDRSIDQLTAEEEADLDASDTEVARRAFASDEAVKAVFTKHRR